jgi:uncharacterized Zn finger protein
MESLTYEGRKQDIRKQRGRRLFEKGFVTQLQNQDFYWIQSEKIPDVGYVVDIVNQRCECPDYLKRLKPCKHYYGALFEKTEIIRKMINQALGSIKL